MSAKLVKSKFQKRSVESILQEIHQRSSKEPLRQFFRILEDSINAEERTVQVAFSSEEEYERWWGIEILSHEPGAVDMHRLEDGAAVLWNHIWNDQRGVVEEASIDADKRGRATLKISRTQAGEDLWMDIVDRIKRHISVGYEIQEMKLTEERKDAPDVYTVTKWMPFEISFVSVPADTSVGVGRSAEDNQQITPPGLKNENVKSKSKTGEKHMDEDNVITPEQLEAERKKVAEEARKAAEKAAVKRVAEITEIANEFEGMEKIAQEFLTNGKSVEEFRVAVMVELGKRQKAIKDNPDTHLGMNGEEVRRYSLVNAINAERSGDWSGAEFERECSERVARKLGKDARGFYVPYDVIAQGAVEAQRAIRALNTGTDSQGGHLVATNHMSGAFIDMLRGRSIAGKLGVRYLTGLVGNLDIPKMLSGASFTWLNEDEDSVDSDAVFGNVTMSPKTISGAVPITRRLLQQSTPDVEGLIWNDLFSGMALAIDAAIFNGDPANKQPRGILNTVGVGTVDFAALAAPTWPELVGMETKFDDDTEGGLGTPQFVLRSNIKGHCKTTVKAAGIPQFIWENDHINGYQATSTKQVPANTTLFGDFNQVIVGMWGTMDVVVDKATKVKSGGVVLRVFQDVDVITRYPQAFIVAKQAA